MGVIERVLNKFGYEKQTLPALSAGTIEKEFGAKPAASRKMEDNLNLWWAMYTNHPPWESCEVRPLGLPGAIGRELSRHALSEFSAGISGSARADYLHTQFQKVQTRLGKDLELGLCLGGIAWKPYLNGTRILTETFTTGFTPTRFDGDGRAVGGVFQSAPAQAGNAWFVKLEYHHFQRRADGSAVYVVENRAFRSGRSGEIGAQVPLKSVPEWSELSAYTVIEHLERPLFAYFKPPAANSIEPNSALGVSVYAGPTADLIRQADEQWEKLLWTFHVAEPKILSDGILEPGQFDDRIFVGGRFTSTGNLFEIFDPEVKDSAYYRGLQYILQRIEYNVGLAFGTISDPQNVEKTATEIMAAKQRQFVTERDIQKALQTAMDDLIAAMNALCDLYTLVPSGAYQVDYSWGDGILDDPETRRQEMALDLQQVSAGLMNDWEFRVKWYGEDEQTAKSMLPGMERLTEQLPQNEVE